MYCQDNAADIPQEPYLQKPKSGKLRQAEKLKEKRARYREVMDILNPPAEQNVAADDDQVQYQRRNARQNNLEPATAREWSAFNRSFANQTNGLKNGDSRNIMITTADNAYFVAADGYMSGEITAKFSLNTQLDEINAYREEFVYGADTRTETPDSMAQSYGTLRGRSDWDHAGNEHSGETGRSDALDGGSQGRNTLGDYWENYGYSSLDEFLDAISDGAMVMDDNGNLIEAPGYQEQLQRRTKTLTDRDVLAIAANDLNTTEMTEAERGALEIFRDRLSRLEDLQEQRAELGRKYKES